MVDKIKTIGSMISAKRIYVLGTIFLLGIGLFSYKLINAHPVLTGLYKPERTTALETLINHQLQETLTTKVNDTPATQTDEPQVTRTVLRVRPGDSITAIFKRENLSLNELNQILSIRDAHRVLRSLTIDKVIEFDINEDGQLLHLKYPITDTRHLSVNKMAESFTAEIKEVALERRIVQASSAINGSVANSLKHGEIPCKIFAQLAKILAPKVDFSRDLREGDLVNVIYQEAFRGETKIKAEHIVAAELRTSKGKSHHVIRYVNSDGKAGYFNAIGESYEQGFLREPVKYTRISSSFSPNRVHPISGRVQPHRGVDMAAPTGTKIIAVGDGKIIHRGRKGGFGNTVILDHGNGITTIYAHMSRYEGGQRTGDKVNKGDVIGYVGMTGVATGPHLHYEYLVNGVHKNPMKVALPSGLTLAASEKTQFLVEANRWLYRLAQTRNNEFSTPAVLAMYDTEED